MPLSSLVCNLANESNDDSASRITSLDQVGKVPICSRSDRVKVVELYMEQFGSRLHSFLTTQVGCPHAAEDVAQDVYLRIFNKVDSFRGDSQFTTWVYRVANNSAKNYLRSQQRHTRRTPEDIHLGRKAHESGRYLLARPPEDHIADAKLQRDINQSMDSLGDRERTILELRSFEELSYKEMAVTLNDSENGIRGKLYRARKKLKRIIDQYSSGIPISSKR